MRCIANTLSNRTSTTTGPTSFSAWTGCWTILRRSFPRRVARWPADDGCFHSDAGPWHEGIPLEALGAARQVFPADLRRDVDLLLHGRGGGDSGGHATRRAVDTSGSLLSFTGRALAHGAGRGWRSEEHTSELQSQFHLVCRLLLEKRKHRKRF